MRKLVLATLLVSGLVAGLSISTQLQARVGKLSFNQLNQLREYITTVGGKTLVSGALLLTLAGAPPAATADNHEAGAAEAQEQQVAEQQAEQDVEELPAWQQQEIMPNDHEWEKQVFYLLVDKGEERFAFHFAYIGEKGNHSLFVGRRRPYGTHLFETHAEGLATSLVGYKGEIAFNIDFTEVAAFYDALDGIINLTVISIKDLDMSDYKPATLATFPYDQEEALRAFTYRPEALPLLKPEEANDQFKLRLLTRECKTIPNLSMDKVRSGVHNCGIWDFAVGGPMFLESTGELVGYHSGTIEDYGIALGMADNLITLANWAAAAAPALQQQRTMTTTWGELKKD